HVRAVCLPWRGCVGKGGDDTATLSGPPEGVLEVPPPSPHKPNSRKAHLLPDDWRPTHGEPAHPAPRDHDPPALNVRPRARGRRSAPAHGPRPPRAPPKRRVMENVALIAR